MTTATNDKAAAPINFKDDLIELKTKLAGVAVVDKEAGVITLPAGTFFAHAPEAVKEEVYGQARQYEDLFAQAASLMAAEAAVGLFKDNKKLDTVTFQADIWGKDTFSRAVHREGVSRNPKTQESTTYAGAMDTRKWNRVSTRTQAEDDLVKKHLRALALDAGLGK